MKRARVNYRQVAVALATPLLALFLAIGVSAGRSAPAAPKLLLKNTTLDTKAGTLTLPVFKGRTASGGAAWYIVTESSSKADAEKRGVNWSPKLRNALGTKAVQRVRLAGGEVVFAGTVNFKPKSLVVPGTQGFPPKEVAPGSVGDARYSPLVTTGNGIVLNASQFANATGRGDNVVSLDTKARRATLEVLTGFTEGTPVFYLRTDASVDVVSALEGSNLAKNLNAAPGLGSNAASSARSAIIPIVNGVRGKANPRRQGLQSAVLGEGSPLNIQQSLPGSAEYSPLWDVTPAVWTTRAIARGQRRRLTSAAQVTAAVRAHRITSAGKSKANSSLAGLKAIGFVSNCPIVAIG